MSDGSREWTVGAVARRLGVAPATLRTWDRRYGLGPTIHEPGKHRRYAERDVERLRRMADLVRRGMSTADAAQLIASGQGDPQAGSGGVATEDTITRDSATGDSVSGDSVSDLAAGSDGDAIRRLHRGLAKSSAALDATAVMRNVEASIEALGVVAAWDRLLRPVLVDAGLRWEATGDGVDIEHLLSDCIAAVLHNRVARAPRPIADARPALLACAADDQHQLPLHVLRAALREQRVGVQLLGASTPAVAVEAATRRLGPSSVVIWSQLRKTADTRLFEVVPVMRPRVSMFAAGPGWASVIPLPDHVARLESLAAGVVAIRESAGLG